MTWEPVVEAVEGRYLNASNVTLLGRVGADRVIYKPLAGMRPLWDFDVSTLAHREVLTYLVNKSLGLGMVPETALGEGPLGPGAVQRVVTGEPALEAVESTDPLLWPIAFLDLVVDNADRKAGHILSTSEGLRAIDHGLTFHSEPHLRTVLWGFAGEFIPETLVTRLDALQAEVEGGELGDTIESWLDAPAVTALIRRIEAIRQNPVHPDPPTDRPPVPWPPV